MNIRHSMKYSFAVYKISHLPYLVFALSGAQNELKLLEAALKNDVEQTRKVLESKVDLNAKGHVSVNFICDDLLISLNAVQRKRSCTV